MLFEVMKACIPSRFTFLLYRALFSLSFQNLNGLLFEVVLLFSTSFTLQACVLISHVFIEQ